MIHTAPSRIFRILAMISLFLCCAGPADAADAWSMKKSATPEDVVAFLNGTTPYSTPVTVARISLTTIGTQTEFIIFYQKQEGLRLPGAWGFHRYDSAEQVRDSLNAGRPLPDFQICSASPQGNTVFYLFARTVPPNR
jgi:hypothetical protein